MASRSRQRSLIGRDIAPLPPIENMTRRIVCRQNLLLFLQSYLKARFDKPFEKPHLTLIERLETIILNGGKQAIAMPRGTGKTAIVISAILWAIVCGHCRYIVMIAANVKESRKLLRGLRRVLANSPFLLADYPEICYPIRELGGSALLARGQRFYGRPTSILIEADTFVLPTIPGSQTSGSKIVAVGIKSAIRGQNEELPTGEIARPDLILIDDPQTDDVARNSERCKNLVDFINATVKYLAGHGDEVAIVMTCTVMVEGDAADMFLDHETHPDWNGLRIAALETMPERMDLWRRFRLLWFSDFDAAKDFYRSNWTYQKTIDLRTIPSASLCLRERIKRILSRGGAEARRRGINGEIVDKES